MPLNEISREEILQIFAEAHGDQEAAFEEVERRRRLGLTRKYTAQCEYCHPEPHLVLKYEEQTDRDSYAKYHSEITSDHVVKISEVWE